MRILLSLSFSLALAALAFPAGAEGLNFSPRAVETCLEAGGGRECIAASAEACMEATEGGYSTAGMNGCLAAAHEWWDGELNARYAELQARARDIDAQEPIEGMRPRPSDVQALRDMQRAWIAFRDASCQYDALQWFGGTGASTTYLACLMRMTGEQALTLRRLLGEG